MQQVCKKVITDAYTNPDGEKFEDRDTGIENMVSLIDAVGIKDVIAECKDLSDEAKVAYCIKATLTYAAKYDPTGILIIAAAFTHPTCAVPRKFYELWVIFV